MSSRSSMFFIFLLVPLFLGQGSGSKEIDGEMQKFDLVMTELMKLINAPGGQLAVAKDGRLKYFKAFGFANRDNHQPMTTDHVIRYNSISKVVTGTTILKLIQEGKLRLDDRPFLMLKHLDPPKGATVDQRIFNITIQNLLQHTGGWNRTSSGIDVVTLPASLYASQSLSLPSTPNPNQMIRFMKGIPLDFDPSSSWEYSNFGFIVLGQVIEKVTGLTYGDYVKKAIFEAVGIGGIKLGKSKLKDLAANEVRYYGTNGSDTPFVSIFPGEGFVNQSYGTLDYSKVDSAGSWIGNAADLVSFIDHIDGLREPRILNQQMVHQMLYAKVPFNTSGIDGSYLWGHTQGLEVFVSLDENSKTIKSFQHNGGAPGANSLFMRLTHVNVTFAALFNTLASDIASFDNWAFGNLSNLVYSISRWPPHDLSH